MFSKDPNAKRASKERRTHQRVGKHLIMSYALKENLSKKFDLTQMRDISLGGMCFISTEPFPRGTRLLLDLKTPYLADATSLEGVVIESRPKVDGIVYETRVQFSGLDEKASSFLKEMVTFFIGEGSKSEKED